MPTYATLFPLAQAYVVWGQSIEAKDLAVVGLLVLLEGILSIDNALVLGLLAKRLPKSMQARALSYGLIGAFVFRFVAIGTASFLLKWTTAKFLGGAYLVYIAVKHLFFESKETEEATLVADAEGQPDLVDPDTGKPITPEQAEIEIKERVPFDVPEETLKAAKNGRTVMSPEMWRKFWWTVFVIEMTDIAFAVDSIVAAIGVVGSPPRGTPENALHPKLWVVVLGGFLGVIVMRFAAAIFIKLLEKFPRFETAAYLLVIVIGMKLLIDWGFNSDWTSWGWTANQTWAHSYVEWLRANSPLGAAQPAEGTHPHLFDFHDLRRPESLIFWFAMAAAFVVGFMPEKNKK